MALNKGMPSYIQMRMPRLDSEHRPENSPVFRLCGLGEGHERVRLEEEVTATYLSNCRRLAHVRIVEEKLIECLDVPELRGHAAVTEEVSAVIALSTNCEL